jgi:hypothetical protein
MEKRYQVFVSSTYADLVEERNEAMQAYSFLKRKEMITLKFILNH